MNNIIITLNSVNNYFKYLNTIFILFTNKNIILSLKKSYFDYPNIELLNFYINGFGLSTIKEYIKAFMNLAFPNNLKVLK
ncbi:hypothetical protein QR685DRAFT_571414 [Neurospora intermedia]|uniref:Uncharacterized protein n=1 Tax=Neurospora intermedia TaxID=5142 RepID=A0ABR3DC68_NEUIN